MKFIIRYLSPFIRSRRRFSFLFIISLLLLVLVLLFIIDFNNSDVQLPEIPLNKEIEIISTTNPSISLSKLITKTIFHIEKKGLWPIDEHGRSLKTNFLTLDLTGFFGSGAGEGERVQCSSSNTTFMWTRKQDRIDEVDFVVSHDAAGGQGFPFDHIQLNQNRQQYTMAFIMESEVHSSTGNNWAQYDFKMSYNLDDSYPEPATYFDANIHIIDLLKPVVVPFEEKEKDADIVWIISNCNAHNGRQDFVQELMKEMKVHSYGSCLNNRQGYGARMTDNVDAYIKYKFVIAIENSNCVDYVTEKLVKAVESGSIPIIAGLKGRPDYRRYMPEHSFINVFDYKSIKELATELKRIANNKTLYESYLWYKKHDKNVKQLLDVSLNEKVKHLADVIGSNATMITEGIAGKEKSENKVCKLIRFVRQTSWKDIANHNRTAREGPSIACLPIKSIFNHFNRLSSNNSQTVKV